MYHKMNGIHVHRSAAASYFAQLFYSKSNVASTLSLVPGMNACLELSLTEVIPNLNRSVPTLVLTEDILL